MHYLDNSATTVVSPKAAQKALEIMTECFGNPSSRHSMGIEAEHELNRARKIVAEKIGATGKELYFTSGGTEANNLALFGAAEAKKRTCDNIVISSVEHSSLLEAADRLEKDGWKVWWFGATPETAEDPDQTLLFLLVNEETDEIDAFRTSVNRIENGEDPVDVSLYLYRDSKSDRMSEEKYNCLFFDTKEGQKSIVKVITDTLADRELEMPLPLEIKLRGFELNGADLTGYAVCGIFFAMNNGNDGEVSMFDGAYEATYDGDVFESPFIVIEGITSGDLRITLKEGQPVWPEWTGEDTARDAAGNEFVRVDGNWYPKGEEPMSANAESEDEAA